MIDLRARQQLAQQRQTESMMQSLRDAIAAGFKTKERYEGLGDKLKLSLKNEAGQDQTTAIEKIQKALVLIYNQIKKPIVIPKILTITGKVDIGKHPSVEIKNFKELEKYFASLEDRIITMAQAASTALPPQINIPKFDIPQKETNIDTAGIISAIHDLGKALEGHEKSPDTTLLRKLVNMQQEIMNRPVMTPQPVTNVWINPSNGLLKSTDNTVGTTLTKLPNYGQLEDRRTLLIYNNSSNTIYWGDSNVSVNTGIPIVAGSFASPLDFGYNVTVYAIASQGNNDVRCVEVSKDTSGTIQE